MISNHLFMKFYASSQFIPLQIANSICLTRLLFFWIWILFAAGLQCWDFSLQHQWPDKKKKLQTFIFCIILQMCVTWTERDLVWEIVDVGYITKFRAETENLWPHLLLEYSGGQVVFSHYGELGKQFCLLCPLLDEWSKKRKENKVGYQRRLTIRTDCKQVRVLEAFIARPSDSDCDENECNYMEMWSQRDTDERLWRN